MDRFVLAVDLGTGGPKVGLATLDGGIVWSEHLPVRTTYGPGGAATQDAGEWWRLVVDSTRRALADTGSRAGQVVAVGITGQWASTVPVDATGLPVGDCVMWMDGRGAPYARRIVGGRVQGYRGRALATWIRHSGGVPSTSGDDPIGHISYLEHDCPEIAARARWYLEPVDYLAMRFTGVAAASHMSMTAAWLTDNRRLDLLAYDATLVRLAGIDSSKLPPLVPSGSVIGPVSAVAAAELGISPAAQVVTGMPDLHGAALGSGCVLDHETHVSIGTTGWVSCPLPAKKTDVIRQLATVPGPRSAPGLGRYLVANNQESAGRCLEWFRDHVAVGVGGERPSYSEITALAATAPAGSGGVVFTPWLAGERSPVDDRTARGGFHNVSLSTSHAHLARAVLEGVALNLRWLLEAVDRFAGRRLDPIRMLGGGAQSDLWCQIVADVCDRDVERVADPLLSGLRGAALAAGLALGEVSPSQVRGLVPVDRIFRPEPAHRAIHDRAYAEFPRLYRAQRRVFRRRNGPDRRPRTTD
jgi:xylulokinase